MISEIGFLYSCSEAVERKAQSSRSGGCKVSRTIPASGWCGMLFEQRSEGTATSEARSRAAVIHGATTLAEQLEEDVQSYDANSPANARSQFSIAVSCEGAVPAASGHRTGSVGGESVESVADPAEGEHSSMPAEFQSRSFLSIARREPSPTPRAPGSPEARRANSVISKVYVPDISVRGGTPASVYAQGTVLPTPRTRASSPQNSMAQSSSGSEAAHPGKRKRESLAFERLEGQASVPLHFARAPLDIAWPTDRAAIRRRSLLTPGEQSVDAVRKGDSQDNADAGISIAGPTPRAPEWRGFAGASTALATPPVNPATALQDLARTAASRAMHGRMGRPGFLNSAQAMSPAFHLGPALLPRGSVLGQPATHAPQGEQHPMNGRRFHIEGNSPHEAQFVGESSQQPIKEEAEDKPQPTVTDLQAGGRAQGQAKSWSSSKDAQKALRDCLSTDTTASRRNQADGHAADVRTITDSHMPEQDAPHLHQALAQDLHRHDSVIAKIEDDSLPQSHEAPPGPSPQNGPHLQAVSWQGSALQENGRAAAGETNASHNVEEGEAEAEVAGEGRQDSLSNAWPARAILVNGAEPALEAGLVAQSEPSRLANGENEGPQPALTIFANEGLAGPKTEADDGAASPYPAQAAPEPVQNNTHSKGSEHNQHDPCPAGSQHKGKRNLSSDGPNISHASNM